MFTQLREYAWFCLELICLHLVKAARQAAIRSNLSYTERRKRKLQRLFKQVKKFLTFRRLSVIIMMNVLTGCGLMTSSVPSIKSCVDLTTYVNNGKTAAQVISKERICEIERLRSMGINIGEK